MMIILVFVSFHLLKKNWTYLLRQFSELSFIFKKLIYSFQPRELNLLIHILLLAVKC